MKTLSAVKRYMEDHARASVSELAVSLDTTPDNARSLLEMWREKRRVRLIPGSCGTCGKLSFGGCNCAEAALLTEVYEWVGRPQDGADVACVRFLGLRRYLTVAHHVPGRIRIKLDMAALAHGSSIDPAPIIDLLKRIHGVMSTRINLMALSVVVDYDADKIPSPLWERPLVGDEAEIEAILSERIA